MEASVQRLTDDWVTYARYENVDDAPEQIAADAQSMLELPMERPELAWEVIRSVVGRYSDHDVFSTEKTEAKRVIGLVAAGPLEDLLGLHGADFIDRIESEAKSDRRMAWALGGVWQFTMSDDLWARVQRTAVNW